MNSATLQEDPHTAEVLTEAAHRRAEESEDNCRDLARQNLPLRRDLEVHERIHALETGVNMQGHTTDTAGRPKDTVIHELDSNQNEMSTAKFLELLVKTKDMEK